MESKNFILYSIIIMKKVTIYGERCSGTNYLQELLLLNFEVEITWEFGWKHFFGFDDLTNSDEVLFIGIVRNLNDWINSLYRERHHVPLHITTNVDTYLTGQFYSTITSMNEITLEKTETETETEPELMEDRNMDTGERYKNIFELRRVKNTFLEDKMPNLVKSYCLITYEDLCAHFVPIMTKLKACGLEVKKEVAFPTNVSYYKQHKDVQFVKKQHNEISKKKIDTLIMDDKELLYYENILFPRTTEEVPEVVKEEKLTTEKDGLTTEESLSILFDTLNNMSVQMQAKLELALSEATQKMESKLAGLPDKLEKQIDLAIATIVKEITVKLENAYTQMNKGVLAMSDNLSKTIDNKLENVVADLETKIDGSLKGLDVINKKIESCCVVY